MEKSCMNVCVNKGHIKVPLSLYHAYAGQISSSHFVLEYGYTLVNTFTIELSPDSSRPKKRLESDEAVATPTCRVTGHVDVHVVVCPVV